MAASAETPRPQTRVERARFYHPAMWARVRAACGWASSEIDLDEHAAGVLELVNQALGRKKR